MLGRLRRVSRLDVGLALAFSGIAYLVWALVAGISRSVVQDMLKHIWLDRLSMPAVTRAVKVFFVDYGIVIDVVGLAWLAVSLFLVVLSSRQQLSISCAWTSAVCQSSVAALGAVLVGWAAYQPIPFPTISSGGTPMEKVSSISLGIVVAVAVMLWVVFLVWLLVQRARFDRRGPTLRDGLKTNIFR